MRLLYSSKARDGVAINEQFCFFDPCLVDCIYDFGNNEEMDGSLMTEKTLAQHLEDYKKQIIKQIYEYESHIFSPRDESYNAGIHRAIEAVEETIYDADDK